MNPINAFFFNVEAQEGNENKKTDLIITRQKTVDPENKSERYDYNFLAIVPVVDMIPRMVQDMQLYVDECLRKKWVLGRVFCIAFKHRFFPNVRYPGLVTF